MSKVTLEYLARLLERAIPGTHIESAALIKASSGLYWIQVEPEHYKYWSRFREARPRWVQVARTYKATGKSMMVDGFCPEFDTLENLLNWLFDVLELTQGERNLLSLLCERFRECLSF